MGRLKSAPGAFENLSKLLDRLGDIPPARIRLDPQPGTATEDDVIHAESRFKCLCELVDGTLVEKPMGYFESLIALELVYFLRAFLQDHNLGFLLGESGMILVEPGQVRMADVAFFSWAHFPDRVLPSGPILDRVPDLAVEVLSPSNTRAEMVRKRKEYFMGGTKLVWEISPLKRTVRVYTAPDELKLVREKGTLEGGAVLPGFQLPVAQLFARAGTRSE